MFVGHLAAGLVLKARVPEASLGALLVATVVSDFLCGLLLLLGIEDLVVHGTPVYGHFEADVGYSHSLLATSGLAALGGYLGARRWRSRRVGIALSLAVLSHYLLDALVHHADMPIVGFHSVHDVLLGTGLAGHPLPYFLVELSWCVGAWWLFDRTNRRLLFAILVLMALYANSVFGFTLPPPMSARLLGALMVVFFVVAGGVIFAAARARPSAAGSATTITGRDGFRTSTRSGHP